MAEELTSQLTELAAARIFFGHHSVGDDMLRGLQSLADEHGVADLQIIDLDCAGSKTIPPASLAHSRVGRNGDPLSKIRGFAHKLREELRPQVELAFMKFCYVDFDPNSDVSSVFEEYRAAMDELGIEFPSTRFVHSTVPLMIRDMRLKSRIKLFLGRAPWRDEANAARQQFNTLLYRHFDESKILDIARVESTRLDGAREEYKIDCDTYYSLNPAYTNDGGHLNEEGGRAVAIEMLRVLARNLRA